MLMALGAPRASTAQLSLLAPEIPEIPIIGGLTADTGLEYQVWGLGFIF